MGRCVVLVPVGDWFVVAGHRVAIVPIRLFIAPLFVGGGAPLFVGGGAVTIGLSRIPPLSIGGSLRPVGARWFVAMGHCVVFLPVGDWFVVACR